MTESLFYFVYGRLLWPLLRLAAEAARFFVPKIHDGIMLRRPRADGLAPWLDKAHAKHEVWIHCASGEFEYAKPVIQKLKSNFPSLRIMVTFFSPSVAEAVREFKGIDFACPLPWDQPGALREFLQWHQPRVLLIARTDTWPEMLRQAKKAGVATLLFSATLSEQAGRARGFGRFLSRIAFRFLDQIYCVSDADRRVLSELTDPEKIVVAGDTRYDQVIARLQSPKPVRDELFKDSNWSKTFIAGSTWNEDEEVLVEVASRMEGRIGFVLVPHEPTQSHIAELTSRLASVGVKSTRYSEAKTWNWSSEVLIVDQIGILAELYQFARFAFVGGSYRKTVHSVMEPLAAGCLTFVGPRHTNNREALKFKEVIIADKLSCVIACQNAAEMQEHLELSLKMDAPMIKDRIQREVKSLTGQSTLVMDWVLHKIKEPRG